jgi:hypothetical protein
MATLWGRVSMATFAAYNEFRRVLADPDGLARRTQHAPTLALYNRRWARYANNIFEDGAFWSTYLNRNGLYRHTRSIFNPARKLGDFYSGIIYPGVLATDAERLPDGTQLAIPLADDIDKDLRTAIGQLWQWSNWQEGMSLMTLYGAVLGDVGVEVSDELDRGKVTFDIIWPGLVTKLELDSTANVKSHVIEYDYEDTDGKTYTYRKEVDGERIAEYRDNELYQYDPDVPAERVNPYGFDPFVWCRHQNLGGTHGAPAFRNEQNVDELNSLASHAYDRAHAILSSPVLVAGAQSNSLLTAANNATKRPSATESTPPDQGARESIRIIAAGPDAKVASIELPEGEVAERMDRLWSNIEHEHPELTMYDKLREMSQVTAPGAEVLVGDTSIYVNKARGGYDTQTIKLHQMGVAIAGWRANTGAWGGRGRSLTRQQQAFLPFDLESYQAGDLDFEIMPRPLIPPPPKEEEPTDGTREQIAAARKLLEQE